MFRGTIDKKDQNRIILVETHIMERLDLSYLPPNCFRMIILSSGSITACIDDVDCFFESPAIICLDELKQFKIYSNNSTEVKIINFNPQFLNMNMCISTVRSANYEHLCEQHSFFQLSPFLTDNINKISFHLSEDTAGKINSSFNGLTQNLVEQKDWYWSCRARSYFIDIINILERIYHNYYIDEPCDTCIKAAISQEFKTMIAYINNHLEEKHTLDTLYAKFRINKNLIEDLFKEFLNTTFYEYLKNRRYEEACYYLRFTDLDGHEIATRIGFSSSQNFCKFFRAIAGVSPSKFRKEMVSNRKGDELLKELLKSRNDSNKNK